MGDVDIYYGNAATELATSVGASALTLGRSIVLGGGYRPEGQEGRRLLAHELVHVDQHRRGALGSHDVVARQTMPPAVDGGVLEDGGETAVAIPANVGASDGGVETSDAGAINPQAACVTRRGGSPEYGVAGIIEPADIARYNNDCRSETGYVGPDVAASVDAYRSELANTSFLDGLMTPAVQAVGWLAGNGGTNILIGVVMIGGALFVISNPVGWFTGLGAALALAGGVASTTIGGVQLVTSGSTTDEQRAQVNNAVNAMRTMSSPGGIAGVMTGIATGADQETAFQYGAYGQGVEAVAQLGVGGLRYFMSRRAPIPASLIDEGLNAERAAANVCATGPATACAAPPPAPVVAPAAAGAAEVCVSPLQTIPGTARSIAANTSAATNAGPASQELVTASSFGSLPTWQAARTPQSTALVIRSVPPGSDVNNLAAAFGPGQCTTAAAVIAVRRLGFPGAVALPGQFSAIRRATAILGWLFGPYYRSNAGTFARLLSQARRYPPGTMVAVSVRTEARLVSTAPEFDHVIVGVVGESGQVGFLHNLGYTEIGAGMSTTRVMSGGAVTSQQLQSYAVQSTVAQTSTSSVQQVVNLRWRFLTPSRQTVLRRQLGSP